MSKSSLNIYFGDSRIYQDNLSYLYPFVTQNEIDRSERFRKPEDKLCYLAAHGHLQKELKRLFGLSGLIQMIYSAEGKPKFAGLEVDFNLSHSGNLFAFVIADSSELKVGIDIECIHPFEHMEEVAKNHFSILENSYINEGGPDKIVQLERFYEIWTRKEAFLKMTGMGLSIPLQEFSLVPENTSPQITIPVTGQRVSYACRLHTLKRKEFIISISVSEDREFNFQEIKI